MKRISFSRVSRKLLSLGNPFPSSAHLELTYRCNFSCVHCYCRGLGDSARELSTSGWKRVMDGLARLGCVSLSLSGGEPLRRKDFLTLYAYAKRKGFLVTVFTNASLIDARIAKALAASPPVCVEATLYGATAPTQAAVTGSLRGHAQAMRGLALLKAHHVPAIVKAVCLKENQHEIVALKHLTEKFLGRPGKGKHRFKYDYVLVPHLSGDLEPCRHRVSVPELRALTRKDKEMRADLLRRRVCAAPGRAGVRELKYSCNSWMHQCVIDPYGYVKFCLFSQAYAFHVDQAPLSRYGDTIRAVAQERFSGKSRCRDCSSRFRCFWCPARAKLETGSDESAVPYYCRLAGRKGV